MQGDTWSGVSVVVPVYNGARLVDRLVQEVADDAADGLARAREIANDIAERAAPLGVRATLASAHLARAQGEEAAIERLRPAVTELFASQDAAEGVQSFIERRDAHFQGR